VGSTNIYLLSQKMWPFVENVPGTAIQPFVVSIVKNSKKNPPSFQLHFHRKCGILWNRYRVQKFGRLTHSSYSLTQKQIITPLSRKMWHFVEKIPGTVIIHSTNPKNLHKLEKSAWHCPLWVWYDVYCENRTGSSNFDTIYKG